jgi:peptidoglycan hydrolase CwlO-like protein
LATDYVKDLEKRFAKLERAFRRLRDETDTVAEETRKLIAAMMERAQRRNRNAGGEKRWTLARRPAKSGASTKARRRRPERRAPP